MKIIQPKTEEDKEGLLKAFQEGKKIEVSCPWWHKDHWEEKKSVTGAECFFEECTYRIL